MVPPTAVLSTNWQIDVQWYKRQDDAPRLRVIKVVLIAVSGQTFAGLLRRGVDDLPATELVPEVRSFHVRLVPHVEVPETNHATNIKLDSRKGRVL